MCRGYDEAHVIKQWQVKGRLDTCFCLSIPLLKLRHFRKEIMCELIYNYCRD